MQKSEARELAGAYAEDVLIAIQDVETNLKNEYELGQQLEHSIAALEALQKAEIMTDKRYLKGVVPLVDLLNIQQELYAALQNTLLLKQAKWNARISLYLALGGDWFGVEAQPYCRNTQVSNNQFLENKASEE